MDIYIFSHYNRIKYMMESYGPMKYELPNTGMIKLTGNKAEIIYPQSSRPGFSRKIHLPSFLTIYLIRHAEAEHNITSPIKRIFKWKQDPSLTLNGINQAKELARKIKKIINTNPIKHNIFCASELNRAQETANIVMRELGINEKIRILPNIGEIIFKTDIIESIISPFVPENQFKKNEIPNLDWTLFYIKTNKHPFNFIIEHLIYFV